MPCNELAVFDLDGTLIRVNSFREICKRSLFKLIRKRSFCSSAIFLVNYGLRKAGLLTHLQFKKRVISFYESWFSEEEKTELASQVFQDYLNPTIYQAFLSRENRMISTACPYAFVSRMPLKKCELISSCHPGHVYPAEDNFQQGKVENLQAHCKMNPLRIHCLYTDSEDDRPLMDCSEQVYMVRDGIPVPMK